MRIVPFPKATLPFQTEASQESRALCLPEGPLTSSAWGQTLPFVQTRCEWLGPGSREALPPGHGPAPTRLLCQPGPRLSGQEHAPGVGGVWSGGPDVPFPVQLSTGLCPRGDRQGLICEGRKFVFPNDSHQGSPREAVGMMGSGMRAPERTPVCLAEPDWPSSPGGARSVFSCSLRLVCVCPRVHPRVLRHTHTAAGRAEHTDGGGGGQPARPLLTVRGGAWLGAPRSTLRAVDEDRLAGLGWRAHGGAQTWCSLGPWGHPWEQVSRGTGVPPTQGTGPRGLGPSKSSGRPTVPERPVVPAPAWAPRGDAQLTPLDGPSWRG